MDQSSSWATHGRHQPRRGYLNFCTRPQGKYIDVVTKVQRRANDAMRGENRQLFEDMMNLTLFPATLEPARSSPEGGVPVCLV